MGNETLPTPQANFTLPSLYDNLELDCRLYFPQIKPESPVTGFAIFAHPYAPLGGSYDDQVVQTIGQLLRKEGFVLATFNFRGAEGSPGKTSWSGKGELGDYVSIYTFMVAFLNCHDVLSHIRSDASSSVAQVPLLLLGGYSYGSMATAHLPDVSVVLEILQHAKDGDPEIEISNRANELAQAFLGWAESRLQRGRSSMSTSFGGYDSVSAAKKISRDKSHRSLDRERVRQSMEHVRRKLGSRDYGNEILGAEQVQPSSTAASSLIEPRLAYLLISPLLGPVSHLATLFSSLHFERRERKATAARSVVATDIDAVLCRETSLIVFGSADHFTSSRKVKDWCEGIKSIPASKLLFEEIADAGHFWQDGQIQAKLVNVVTDWLEHMLSSHSET